MAAEQRKSGKGARRLTDIAGRVAAGEIGSRAPSTRPRWTNHDP